MMSGWFKFVQTEDGSVPAVFHNNGDDSGIINFISAAFQANFKGTSRKVEADPQSLHVAEYTYVAIVSYIPSYDNVMYSVYIL